MGWAANARGTKAERIAQAVERDKVQVAEHARQAADSRVVDQRSAAVLAAMVAARLR